MATDLVDYAQQAFPRHEIAPWRDHEGLDSGELTLQPHTLVIHVVGTETAGAVLTLVEGLADGEQVRAVVVRTPDPSIVRQDGEDPDGIVDLPLRRLVVAAVLGAVLGMGVGTAIGALASESLTPALVIGAFIAVVGAALGAVAGGGARFAGERATSQPPARGEDVTIIAAFFDNEDAATSLARKVAGAEHQFDMRIVSADGSWHAPAT